MFAAILFNACTNDEDNGGGSHASMVSQIIEQDEDGRTWIWNFDYDNQGRVTKITFDGEYTTEFTYSGNKVTIIKDGDLFFQATLNKQGYIATLLNIECTDNYFYDEDGYVSKLTCSNADADMQCIWNNGDLVNERRTGDNPRDYTYEYTDYPAKQNIDIYAFIWGYGHAYDPSCIGAVGLVGRKNAHLIKKGYGAEGNASYDYELDDHGNPTKVTEIFNLSIMTSRTRIYKILYK